MRSQSLHKNNLFWIIWFILFQFGLVLTQSEAELQLKSSYSQNDLSLIYVWVDPNINGSSNSSSIMKGIFFPRVDVFTQLEIRDSTLSKPNIQKP
jgi:hypothetical protein